MRGRRNILIAFAAFVIGMLGAILYLREPTQPLTPQALDAARKLWRDGGIRAYVARFRMNASLYEVRCRDGIVEDLTVDGRISNIAEVRSYSVDGLFDLLELEIVNLNDTKGPFGPNAPALMARVRFNADFGYPERYIRAGGMARGASIEMLEFKRLN
ncbi:MAG: hypothetical protein AAB341_00335 [Planctomycetota bacterium]